MPKFSRDFGSPQMIEREVEFRLFGHAFECVSDISAGVLEDYFGAFQNSSEPNPETGDFYLFVPMNDEIRFIASCLTSDEDREIFKKIRHERYVSPNLIVDIKQYLFGIYTDRPTTEPSPNVDGSAPNGNTSPASAGEPDSTPAVLP